MTVQFCSKILHMIADRFGRTIARNKAVMEILSRCSRTLHVCLDERWDSENHGESFTKWE